MPLYTHIHVYTYTYTYINTCKCVSVYATAGLEWHTMLPPLFSLLDLSLFKHKIHRSYKLITEQKKCGFSNNIQLIHFP